MIKLIGFAVIVASCTKIGIDLSQKYCDRTRCLKYFINMLERVKSEISFSNCTITNALQKSVDSKNNVIGNMIRSILNFVEEKPVTLDEAFNIYIKGNETISFLEKKDLEEFGRFFSMVGSGDRDDEINNINNSIGNLTLCIQESYENEKKYVKLFRTSGILTGLLIAIILV